MELVTYKQFPKPMRQIASNTWVRELMYRVDVKSISDLIRSLEGIEGREVKSNSEKRSDFWYHVLKKRPVKWLGKINEIDALFPDTKSILDSLFWQFILYVKVKNVTPESNATYNRYMGPRIDDEQLMNLANGYATRSSDLSFSDIELEQIHSVHGLAALIASNCQMKYREQNTEQFLSCIYRTFLRTFALRYQTDFAWDIFQLLQLHLADDTTPELPQYFAEIDSEDLLFEKLNQIKIAADKLVVENKTENTAKSKLIYLARYQPN